MWSLYHPRNGKRIRICRGVEVRVGRPPFEVLLGPVVPFGGNVGPGPTQRKGGSDIAKGLFLGLLGREGGGAPTGAVGHLGIFRSWTDYYVKR